MLDEVMTTLALRPGETVVDGTLGLAGHATEMAAAVAPGGAIIGFDWDESMLAIAQQRLADASSVTVITHHADYREIPERLAGDVDAIFLDLGLNNAQIEDADRGISFRQDGPLDMRMDRSRGEPAAAWLNRASGAEIERVLREFGDENWAKKIAEITVDRRRAKPLKTTNDLVDIVMAAIPPSKREKRLHPATRTFQAIRIYINRELDDLEDALVSIGQCLAPGGRMVALSYHSGEDRAVKRAFRRLHDDNDFEELVKKPLVPSAEEVERNPKSRSAKLRAIKRPRTAAGETA